MNKEKAGYIEGLVSIGVNLALFVLKLWAGIVSNSIALTADAWHTLSDSISSVVVIISAKLSSKKPDSAHPFGHGRWELIASIFIGFILAVIAYDFLVDSIVKFNSGESASFGTLAILITIISIVVNEGLAQYAFYLAKKTDNSTVRADGWHHRTDALSSVIVLIGILLKDYFWWIDSLLGVIISLLLFYVVYEIIKEAINKLLGEKPKPELIKQIEEITQAVYDKNLSPHHFHIHNYIAHQELTFHIKLDQDLSILKGHAIATEIENRIHDELKIETTVHLEPHDFDHRSD